MRTTEGYGALTEREKQTLRLIVRGHDAKSIARNLDLSVHTVNERLREARRKMAVSSSREAARRLLQTEGDGPNFLVDQKIGEAAAPACEQQGIAPMDGAGRPRRFIRLIIGVTLMTLALALVALIALPQPASSPPKGAAEMQAPTNDAVAQAARDWLVLIDGSRWDDSYRATGNSFRTLNTLPAWIAASEKVRAPLGTVLSRELIDRQNLPAPPSGYEVVKFRTRFANKPDAVETVTLDREDGNWRVVGVTIG